jgi:hypothetical protein
VAAGIPERERGETIRLAVADPPIFRQDGGPSIAEVSATGYQWLNRFENAPR